jgi:two-component system sensor histidine kinase KdpD
VIRHHYLQFLLRPEPPSRRVGVVAGALAVAVSTLLVYPLKHVAPVVSLGVVYMLAVLVVAAIWGSGLGALTALASALAFNFFHLPSVGRFTIRHSQDWVALIAFLIAAGLASSVAELGRTRAREADERRREADLAAEMARLLLRGGHLSDTLPTVAARLAQALELPSSDIELSDVAGDGNHVAFPLNEAGKRLGTLLVPPSTPVEALNRVKVRVVPALEALLSAALERERLQGAVVETAALRRADVVKTALLRAVSHDLRSPLTAIRAAGEAVASASLSQGEREELASVVQEESRRLSKLVENLLDLSRLEAGAATPRREWISLEEIIRVALDELNCASREFTLSIADDLPLIQADGVQLERAFVNVLENARQHAGGHTVLVRARARGGRVHVRVIDRGPGIAPAQLERVFAPFYRAPSVPGDYRGSGLGLAIARGFVEANGGSLHVESTPGQGATFVFALPVETRTPASDGEGPSEAFARVPISDSHG